MAGSSAQSSEISLSSQAEYIPVRCSLKYGSKFSMFEGLEITISPPYCGLPSLSDHVIVFFISFVARIIIATILSSRIKEVRVNKKIDGTRLFFDLVLARPLNGALHQTHMTLILAEQEIERIGEKTQTVLTTAVKPVRPHIKRAVNVIDRGLDRMEPLRKRIESEGMRRHKKETYNHLVNTEYNKELMKYYTKKKRKKLYKR